MTVVATTMGIGVLVSHSQSNERRSCNSCGVRVRSLSSERPKALEHLWNRVDFEEVSEYEVGSSGLGGKSLCGPS